MPVDVKKWLAEQAAALNLDETEKAAAEKLLTSEKFRGDFVALPDFHSALDKQKTKFRQEYDEVVTLNTQWQEEYDAKYAPALEAVEKLRKAGYDVSNVRVDNQGDMTNRGQNITLEQIEQLIAQRVEPMRAGTVEYSTFVADKAVEHFETYGKRFNAAEFRKFGYEHREKYPTLESAYNAFTEQDRQAKEAKDKEDWKKQERDNIRIELMSQMTIPEASGGFASDNSPAFLASEQKDDVSREQNRQAFAKSFIDMPKITSG